GAFTNTKQTHTYDNLIFNRAATVEFTGRSGIFDVLREFNLTLDQALQVSDHFPAWAEFSAYEGGPAGRVADREAVPNR
ncbi:MAG TPA: endonuclease/exonuclease/phosphatase, partial [Pirellulales bacterium]